MHKGSKENGIVNIHLYEPDILVQMGLPFDADGNAIKKKFRELAKDIILIPGATVQSLLN